MQIKTLILVALMGVLHLTVLQAQQTFTVSIFNNALSLPGGSFSSPFHPGVDVGWVLPIREGKRWDQMLILRAGYYHQRLVHHGLQAYGEYTWRYKIVEGLAAEGAAGLGYIHTLEQHDIFKLQSDGTYKQVGQWGKPHGQASFALGISFSPPEWPVRPFLTYRFRVLTPFVNEYVPVLPATSLHIGTYFTLFNAAKS